MHFSWLPCSVIMVSLMPWFRQAQAKISFSVWLVSQTWAIMVLHLILVLFVIILHLICLKDHLLSYRCTMQKLMKRNTQRLEDRYLLMDKNILYNSYWLLQSFWSYDLQSITRILSKQIPCLYILDHPLKYLFCVHEELFYFEKSCLTKPISSYENPGYNFSLREKWRHRYNNKKIYLSYNSAFSILNQSGGANIMSLFDTKYVI